MKPRLAGTITRLVSLWPCIGCRRDLTQLNNSTKEVSMKLSELTPVLTALASELDKAKAEIVGKIAELESALSDVDVPADAQAAIDALKAKAQSLDDIVPDAPVPPPAQ